MKKSSTHEAENSRPANNLLRTLREEDYALLQASLQPWQSNGHDRLYNPGDNVETVYFPCAQSLASFLIINEDGRDVDTVLIGREGAVGGIVSHGNLPAYSKIVVKFGGPFVRLKLQDLEAAKKRSPSLRALFARYADCLLAQVLQSTACNAVHSIEQRTAKWIIAAVERGEDDVLPLTQEEIAKMLGVGRSYASRVIQSFKTDGMLDTRRGSLVVLDRAKIKSRACLCNDSVKAHFESVLKGVYPDDDQ